MSVKRWIDGKRTRAYQAWRNMLFRCTRQSAELFHRYGGRGITVCERWQSFEAFLADMGEPPEGTSLDRIDNDGNYEPGNCRWATPKQQSANTSSVHPIVIDGISRPLRHWAQHFGIDERTVHGRIRRGIDPISALTTPPDPTKSRRRANHV